MISNIKHFVSYTKTPIAYKMLVDWITQIIMHIQKNVEALVCKQICQTNKINLWIKNFVPQNLNISLIILSSVG